MKYLFFLLFVSLTFGSACKQIDRSESQSTLQGQVNNDAGESITEFQLGCDQRVDKKCLLFRPHANDFDPHNSLLMALLASEAYQNSSTIRKNLLDLGFTQVIYREVHDFSYYIASYQRTLFVAFRGTVHNLANYLADVNASFTRLPIGSQIEAHTGFAQAYNRFTTTFRDDVAKSLDSAPIDSIWLTGHSLGGALASIAAIDLNSDKADVELKVAGRLRGLMTFGAPRVFSASVRNVDDLAVPVHERYVFAADIVPKLPTPVRGFVHAGRARHFSEKCLLSDSATALDLVHPGKIRQHSMKNYIDCLLTLHQPN